MKNVNMSLKTKKPEIKHAFLKRCMTGPLWQRMALMFLSCLLLVGMMTVPVYATASINITTWDQDGVLINEGITYQITDSSGTNFVLNGNGNVSVAPGDVTVVLKEYPAGYEPVLRSKTLNILDSTIGNEFKFNLKKLPAGSSPTSEGSAAPQFQGTPSSEWPFQVLPDTTHPGFFSNSYCGLDLYLQNMSDETLQIDQVLLETATDGASFPFEINTTRIQARIYPYSQVAPYNTDGDKVAAGFGQLFVREDVTEGYYSLNFVVRYRSSDEMLYEQKVSYQIYVVGKPKEKEEQRFLLETADLPVQQGYYTGPLQLQFGIVNRGFDVADIISVAPVMSDNVDSWPFEIERSDYTIPVDKQLWPVSAQQTPTVEGQTMVLCDFGTLTVRADVSTGYKKIEFVVKFKYGSQAIQEATLSSFVNLSGNPAEDAKKNPQDAGRKSVPRLICTGFTTDPEKVMGGIPFKLNLNLKNTSVQTAIQNIRIVLTSAGGGTGDEDGTPFIPASGASSIFVPYIEADSEYVLSVDMISSVKMPQKAYPLNIKMEYEDMEANPIQGDESVSIRLWQEVRIDTGKIEMMPAEVNVGSEANVMFPLYNKGKTKLYNVTITVPEGQGISAAEAFLGNIEPGATGQVDMMMPTGEQGELLDPEGNPILDEKGNMIGPDGMPIGNGQGDFFSKLPVWAWGLVCGGLFVILIILIRAIRKSKHKKRIAMEDDRYFREMMK